MVIPLHDQPIRLLLQFMQAESHGTAPVSFHLQFSGQAEGWIKPAHAATAAVGSV